MARTIAEIQQDMVTAKEAESGLSGLTSTSVVAIWRKIFYVCAVAIKVIEDLFDVLRDDVEERRLEIPVGILKWYASESLLYQFGDELVFVKEFTDDLGDTITTINNILTYSVIDPTKYVVDLAAADRVNGVIVIKAAKLNNGVAEKLSVNELAGFTQYWKEKRFAGESLSIISVDPDLLKASYRITYNAQILASDGSLLTDSSTFPVEDAITDFLQDFQSDNFAGVMYVSKLTDAIQAVSGVLNVIATNIEGKADGAVSYTDILAIAGQKYTATAGYMKIDPAFPLSGSLTYVLS